MKLILNINDKAMLLTYEQMEAVTSILADSTTVAREYMGGNVPEAERYKTLLVPTDLGELKVSVMDDARYESLKLITKLHNEAKQ